MSTAGTAVQLATPASSGTIGKGSSMVAATASTHMARSARDRATAPGFARKTCTRCRGVRTCAQILKSNWCPTCKESHEKWETSVAATTTTTTTMGSPATVSAAKNTPNQPTRKPGAAKPRLPSTHAHRTGKKKSSYKGGTGSYKDWTGKPNAKSKRKRQDKVPKNEPPAWAADTADTAAATSNMMPQDGKVFTTTEPSVPDNDRKVPKVEPPAASETGTAAAMTKDEGGAVVMASGATGSATKKKKSSGFRGAVYKDWSGCRKNNRKKPRRDTTVVKTEPTVSDTNALDVSVNRRSAGAAGVATSGAKASSTANAPTAFDAPKTPDNRATPTHATDVADATGRAKTTECSITTGDDIDAACAMDMHYGLMADPPMTTGAAMLRTKELADIRAQEQLLQLPAEASVCSSSDILLSTLTDVAQANDPLTTCTPTANTDDTPSPSEATPPPRAAAASSVTDGQAPITGTPPSNVSTPLSPEDTPSHANQIAAQESDDAVTEETPLEPSRAHRRTLKSGKRRSCVESSAAKTKNSATSKKTLPHARDVLHFQRGEKIQVAAVDGLRHHEEESGFVLQYRIKLKSGRVGWISASDLRDHRKKMTPEENKNVTYWVYGRFESNSMVALLATVCMVPSSACDKVPLLLFCRRFPSFHLFGVLHGSLGHAKACRTLTHNIVPIDVV